MRRSTTLGTGTTLLVDTYDVEQGIRTAVEVAGTGLGGIRLDSGDLPTLATHARELLDSLGATGTRIIVTSDLDEYAIAGLQAAPVDGYGVGTSLVTGSGAPTAGMVYKLVERDGVPVAKKSEGKRSVGGRKSAVRRHDGRGRRRRRWSPAAGVAARDGDRDLLVPLRARGRAGSRELAGRGARRGPRPPRAGAGRAAAGGVGALARRAGAGDGEPSEGRAMTTGTGWSWWTCRTTSARAAASPWRAARPWRRRSARTRLRRRRMRPRGGHPRPPHRPRRPLRRAPGLPARPGRAHCVVGTGGVELHPALDRGADRGGLRQGRARRRLLRASRATTADGDGALADWLRAAAWTPSTSWASPPTTACGRRRWTPSARASPPGCCCDLTAGVAEATTDAALDQLRTAGVELDGTVPPPPDRPASSTSSRVKPSTCSTASR